MVGHSPLHGLHTDVSTKIMLNYAQDIDLWMQDLDGMTILHWGANNRNPIVHQILSYVQQKSNILSCLEIKDSIGWSVLHYAIGRGELDLTTFLLASPYATNMSMPDNLGRTLLHHAALYSRMDVIDLLLDMNFKIDGVDSIGQTVLHHAAKSNNLQAVRRLIQVGAGYQLVREDRHGRTPLQLAQQRSNKSLAEYLKSLANVQDCGEMQELKSTETDGSEVFFLVLGFVLILFICFFLNSTRVIILGLLR
jgi:ankyrin repeat protein